MGFLDVNQVTLAVASILMIIPIFMIALSLILRAPMNRAANVTAGCIYTLIQIGNIVGESWAYYYVFGVAELMVIAAIIYTALFWPRPIPIARGTLE